MGVCQSAPTTVETFATSVKDKNTAFVLTLAERNKMMDIMMKTRLAFERSIHDRHNRHIASLHDRRERHLASLHEEILERRAETEYDAKEAELMRELEKLMAADKAAKQIDIQANVASIG